MRSAFAILILTLTVLFFNCSFEDLFSNILEDNPADSLDYVYIGNPNDLKLEIYFDKFIANDNKEENEIRIYSYDSSGANKLIKDGYVKINGMAMAELETSIFHKKVYELENINISCDSTYTIEVRMSDSSIFSEILDFPSKNVSALTAGSIDNLSDMLTIVWEGTIPDGVIYTSGTVQFGEKQASGSRIDLSDTTNTYTFEENYFVNSPFVNDSISATKLIVFLNTIWSSTDFSEYFNDSKIIVYYEYEKIAWVSE